MGYVYKEYPKSLFRIDADGNRREQVFHSAEDVTPGWVDLADLPDAKPDAPASPLSNKEAAAAGKRLVALERENLALKDTVKLYEDERAAMERETKALRDALDAAQALITEQGGEGVEAPPVTEPTPKKKRKA